MIIVGKSSLNTRKTRLYRGTTVSLTARGSATTAEAPRRAAAMKLNMLSEGEERSQNKTVVE